MSIGADNTPLARLRVITAYQFKALIGVRAVTFPFTTGGSPPKLHSLHFNGGLSHTDTKGGSFDFASTWLDWCATVRRGGKDQVSAALVSSTGTHTKSSRAYEIPIDCRGRPARFNPARTETLAPVHRLLRRDCPLRCALSVDTTARCLEYTTSL